MTAVKSKPMNRHNQRRDLQTTHSAASPRAALYMRVSTGRQAEHDLSIPDQRAQLKSWCRANGHEVVAEFVESGSSATDDRRPVFQQMIERACDGEHAFDLILVHSYSRFFREAFEQEFYLRKLAKHAVRVISITQPVGDEGEPVQAMMRKVIALFDEYQSKENAKHVIRSMKENARQGFWNGATCPLGYKLVEAERRGAKIKKRLAIDPIEADTVRQIYKLYLYGDGISGALGVKEIIKWLNEGASTAVETGGCAVSAAIGLEGSAGPRHRAFAERARHTRVARLVLGWPRARLANAAHRVA
jgi:site-specific DNA recombinase